MADLDEELEEAATDAMSVALSRFARALKAKLRAAGSVSEIEPALVRALWAVQVPGLLSVVGDGWDAGLAETSRNLRVDVRPRPLASERMLARAGNRMVDFADELWEVTRAQLVEGVAAGEGIGQLAARLGRLPGLAEPRATVVARTEVVSASNAASLAVAQKSGVVAMKRWLATGDDRTRPAHADADGQTVPVDDPFTVDGEELLYPGDPAGSPENTINCRCVLTWETVEQTGDVDAEAMVAAAEEATMSPWHVEEGGGDCAEGQFAVVKDDDGSTAGCHDTREEAETQLAALYASETDENAVELVAEGVGVDVEHFHAVAIVDGVETKEIPKRLFYDTTWRELPLPLMWQAEDSHGGEPPPTRMVGKITRASKVGDEVHVWGTLDLEGDDGREFARRLVAGFVKGVSVDAGDLVADDVELLWPDTEPESEEDLFMMAEPETVVLHGASLLGLTAVAFPAWDGPFIQPLGALTDTVEPAERADDDEPVTVAASHVIELQDRPPAWWFDEPADQPVLGALTVTDEGRLFGWLAPDNVGHISPLFAGRTVPLGADYRRFYRGQPVRCEDGTERMAGNVTMGCNHAPRNATVPEVEQFENTCAVFGRVALGERKGTGVWVAGYVLPSVTADQVERAMACQLSGYWRPKERGSGVELFSALLVPVPGFPMARRSLRQTPTLVASAVPVRFGLAEDGCGCWRCRDVQPTMAQMAAVHGFAAAEGSKRQERVAAYAALVNEQGA